MTTKLGKVKNAIKKHKGFVEVTPQRRRRQRQYMPLNQQPTSSTMVTRAPNRRRATIPNTGLEKSIKVCNNHSFTTLDELPSTVIKKVSNKEKKIIEKHNTGMIEYDVVLTKNMADAGCADCVNQNSRLCIKTCRKSKDCFAPYKMRK